MNQKSHREIVQGVQMVIQGCEFCEFTVYNGNKVKWAGSPYLHAVINMWNIVICSVKTAFCALKNMIALHIVGIVVKSGA